MKTGFALTALSILYSLHLHALPSGFECVQGSAHFQNHGNGSATVANNPNAIIHWNDFSIKAKESLHFAQANAASAVLNRVTGNQMSSLMGSLTSNGKVYLLNPNGVLIGPNALIQTAGFLASTSKLMDAEFLQGGTLTLFDPSDGKIVNKGQISCPHAEIYLIAKDVVNEGSCSADFIGLGSGVEVIIQPQGTQRLYIRPDMTEQGSVINAGSLQALAVEMKSASPYEKAIQQSGVINALSTQDRNGRIYLVASQGGACIDGAIHAESGEVHVLGQAVMLDSNALLDVSGDKGGKVLIGGDFQGANPDILNSKKTVVGQGAAILADGHRSDAGKIIIWSDGQTLCDGQLNARASGLQGDGGFIEVSGVNEVGLSTHPNLCSAHGKSGTLLLDPGSITIQSGPNVAPPASLATVNDGWINAQLALGSLTLSTANATNAATPTLTVNATVAIAWSSGNDLSLISTQSLIMSSGASIIASDNSPTNGPGSITLQGGSSTSPYPATATGITIGTNTIKTTGVPTVAQPGTITITGISGTSGSGSILTSSTIQSAGDLTIYGETLGQNGSTVGLLLIGTSLSSTSGNVNLTGDASKNSSNINSQSTFGLQLANTGNNTISSTTGNINFVAYGRATTGTGISQSPALIISGTNSAIITASQNVSITATAYCTSIGGISPNDAIRVGSSTSITAGSISITGTGSTGSGRGIAMQNTTLNSTGMIHLTGIGGRASSSFGGTGVFLSTGFSANSTYSGSEAIKIVGTAPTTLDGSISGVLINSGASISTTSGEIDIQGSSVTPVSGGVGITLDGSGTQVTTSNGSIQMTGTGGSGSSNRGIVIQNASKVTSTGTGTISLNGTAGAGSSSCIGVLITGVSTNVTSSNNGSITITGLSTGTGASSDGIDILSGGTASSTGSGDIYLMGTSSSSSTANSSNAILISGSSSAVSTVSSNIHLTPTNQSGGTNNIGLNVSSAGKISSTSGQIIGTCNGGPGVSGSQGVVVSGASSLITTQTGLGIQLTGNGNGTTTSNQGIYLSGGGAITTTSNAPISLTGVGSASGTSSNEGVFITGAASNVTTATGAIQITGTAGGGTSNGISINSSGNVLCTTSGTLTLNSSNAAVDLENNSSIQTQGSAGPGINDIFINSVGLSVIGGGSGSAYISTLNGNINVASSTGLTTVTGSSATNSFGQITVGNSANTITLNTQGITMSGGSGAGAFAEISTIGGLLTIDGAGPISITGGSNTNSYAQIITKTNPILGNAIRIGQTTPPTTLTLQGGSGATARAVIASDLGGHMLCRTTSSYSFTGGTSGSDSRAGIYTGLTSGSGDIILSGAGYTLTGGPSGSGYNSAEIMAASSGSNIHLSSTSSNYLLQGGGGTTSNARIITMGIGDINITGSGNFSVLGGSGTSSIADVNAQGTLTTNIGSGNYVLTGGSGTSSIARFTATGAVQTTGSNYTLAAGSNATIDASNAVIESTGTNGSVTLHANNTGTISLNGGSSPGQNSYIRTTAASGANPITLYCTALNINGSTTSGATNASAQVTSVRGDLTVVASADIQISGGLANGSDARIYSSTQGAISVQAANLNVLGGSGVNFSGLQTQSGDITVTCSGNCNYDAPTAGSLAVMQTFGSNLTLNSAGSISLLGNTIFTTAAPGNMLLIANVDIQLESLSALNVLGNASSSLTLVADNAYPSAPNYGPGKIVIQPGAQLTTGGLLAPVQIYSSAYQQDSVPAGTIINGQVFTPGTICVDTPTQIWNYWYQQTLPPSSPVFVFIYKSCQGYVPPIPPTPAVPTTTITAAITQQSAVSNQSSLNTTVKSFLKNNVNPQFVNSFKTYMQTLTFCNCYEERDFAIE